MQVSNFFILSQECPTRLALWARFILRGPENFKNNYTTDIFVFFVQYIVFKIIGLHFEFVSDILSFARKKLCCLKKVFALNLIFLIVF